jgi:hypothetical protein
MAGNWGYYIPMPIRRLFGDDRQHTDHLCTDDRDMWV